MPPTPQQGILNRPPDHALLVAANFRTTDPASTRAATERLRDLVHKELRSQLDPMTPDSPKEVPSPETGELGFESGYDRYHLTITVAFGSSYYERIGTAERPADLRPIPWGQLGDAPIRSEQSDLLLQICVDSVYLAEHVVRRVTEELGDVLQILWVLPGSQRHTSRRGRASREDGRALIGFLDGTSNLRPKTEPADRRLVFVDPQDRADLPPKQPDLPPAQPNPYSPGSPQPTFPPDLNEPPGPEPAWTDEGTYMVVRASVIKMPEWDKTTLGEQETIIGRRKVTGNPMGTSPDAVQHPIPEPDFSSDPSGAVTALRAHIRKANPRGPGDDLRRVFRRGYPLILPGTAPLELGLAFVCFARTITTQFEFMTRGWITNENFPLPGTGVDLFRHFESAVLGGGYYFVPPLKKASQPWSWVVPD